MTSMTDPKGNTWTYFYDNAGQLGHEFRLYVRPDTVFRGQAAKLYEYDGFTRVDVPEMGP